MPPHKVLICPRNIHKKLISPLSEGSIYSISCCNIKICYTTYCFSDVWSCGPRAAVDSRPETEMWTMST